MGVIEGPVWLEVVGCQSGGSWKSVGRRKEGQGRTDETGTKGFGIIDISGVPEA